MLKALDKKLNVIDDDILVDGDGRIYDKTKISYDLVGSLSSYAFSEEEYALLVDRIPNRKILSKIICGNLLKSFDFLKPQEAFLVETIMKSLKEFEDFKLI